MPLVAAGPSGAGPLISPALAGFTGLVHGFTDRSLGTAEPDGTATTQALRALHRGENFTRWPVRQVHGVRVLVVDGADRPLRDSARSPAEADAVVVGCAGHLALVRTADCVPALVVAVADDRPLAATAIHAGWRGLAAGVIEAAIGVLGPFAPGGTLHAALGPCIGPCCYEVGAEVADAVAARAGSRAVVDGSRGARPHVDLPTAAALILGRLGVRVADGPPPCTRCEPLRFHSHRADGSAAGRLAAFIGWEQASA